MKLIFELSANEGVVSEHSKNVLRAIGVEAGLRQAYISSTQRDATSQARAMYDNCEATGVSKQLALYRAPGQAVIRAYVQCKARRKGRLDTIAEMARAITEIGPAKVSRHCADPATLNVIDIRPSRMSASESAAFAAAVEDAVKEGRVSKFLRPPADPAFHLEIPQIAEGTS